MNDELNLEQMQEIESGACSTVYRYGDKALKLLNESGRKIANEHTPDKLVGTKNGTFVFPEKIIKDANGEIIAYIMEIVEGKGFIDDDVIKKIDIAELIQAILQVESDLREISRSGIITNDMNHKNIMWDDKSKRIKIIDTENFIINENLSEQEIYVNNLSEFNLSIKMSLGCMGSTEFEKLRNNPKFSELYQQYMVQEILEEAPSTTQLISCLVDIAKDIYGKDFKTLEEIEQIMREKGDWIETVIDEDYGSVELEEFLGNISESYGDDGTEIIVFSEQEIAEGTKDIPGNRKEKSKRKVENDIKEFEKADIDNLLE